MSTIYGKGSRVTHLAKMRVQNRQDGPWFWFTCKCNREHGIWPGKVVTCECGKVWTFQAFAECKEGQDVETLPCPK